MHHSDSKTIKIISTLVGICFLLSIFFTYQKIIHINEGGFSFIMDDAYIHLSFIYNLIHFGHHGSSFSCLSAPTSSVIWPFLLAPFAYLGSAALLKAPLVLNILFVILLIITYHKFFVIYICDNTPCRSDIFLIYLITLICLLAITNVIAMVFCGMEHTLHPGVCFLQAVILIHTHNKNLPTKWMVCVLIIAPFVRFESLAMSACAILMLITNKQIRYAALLTLAIGLPLLGYGLFLNHIHESLWLPGSILAKKSFAQNWANWPIFERIIIEPFPFLFSIAGIFLWFYKPTVKKLILCLWLVVMAQQFTGMGVYFRYFPGFHAFFLPIMLYCLKYQLINTDQVNAGKLFFVALVLITCLTNTFMKPKDVAWGSNNIFSQQFQLHRFVQHYYSKPTIANDVGWLSWQNTHAVHDLIGLSEPAMMLVAKFPVGKRRMYYRSFAKKNKVGLAMLYPLFSLPKEWIKIASLNYSGKLITAAHNKVDFYATSKENIDSLLEALKLLETTLPKFAYINFIKQ